VELGQQVTPDCSVPEAADVGDEYILETSICKFRRCFLRVINLFWSFADDDDDDDDGDGDGDVVDKLFTLRCFELHRVAFTGSEAVGYAVQEKIETDPSLPPIAMRTSPCDAVARSLPGSTWNQVLDQTEPLFWIDSSASELVSDQPSASSHSLTCSLSSLFRCALSVAPTCRCCHGILGGTCGTPMGTSSVAA